MRAKHAFLVLMGSLALLLAWAERKGEQHSVPGASGSVRLLSPDDDQGRALQAELDRTFKRVCSKLATSQKVIDGEWTLHQAAARFADLDATQSPRFHALWRATCPGDTDEECYQWTVLRTTAAVLQDRPAQARAILERLQEELPEHLRRRLADDLLSTEWDVSRRPAREQAESSYK
jgi:hypothetical protein